MNGRTATPTIDRWQAGFRLIRLYADALEREQLVEFAEADARARLMQINPTLARQVWPLSNKEAP